MEGYFAAIGDMTASLCDGRVHYTLYSKVKLQGDVSEDALRHAWKQMRCQQPNLAEIIESTKKVYEVPDETALQAWLGSTFITCDQPPEFKPIERPTLYFLPKSSEVILRAHHASFDGIGVLLFWDRFLNALAAPSDVTFGDEHSRLRPSLADALGAEPSSPAQSDKAMAQLMDWAAACPGIGPVSKIGAAPSGASRSEQLAFPAEHLVRACKSKGVSVTAAVHAAYVCALQKHADPESKLEEYVTMTSFNLRPYLPAPYNSSDYAASMYYTPLPYKAPLPASFWDMAKSLHEYYQTSYKGNKENLAFAPHFQRATHQLVQMPEFQTAPIPKDPLITSLGVVDDFINEYRGVKVQDITMGVEVVMGMPQLFIYTFAGQLRLVYCFNDGFEERQNVKAYLAEVQDILAQELTKNGGGVAS